MGIPESSQAADDNVCPVVSDSSVTGIAKHRHNAHTTNLLPLIIVRDVTQNNELDDARLHATAGVADHPRGSDATSACLYVRPAINLLSIRTIRMLMHMIHWKNIPSPVGYDFCNTMSNTMSNTMRYEGIVVKLSVLSSNIPACV